MLTMLIVILPSNYFDEINDDNYYNNNDKTIEVNCPPSSKK